MEHKVGDYVRLFGSDDHVEITAIEQGVIADIYGTIIDAYKVDYGSKLYVDIFDGTISEI